MAPERWSTRTGLAGARPHGLGFIRGRGCRLFRPPVGGRPPANRLLVTRYAQERPADAGRQEHSSMRKQRVPDVKSRPALDGFEDRVVPALPIPAGSVLVTPDDGGIPRIKVVDPATGQDVHEFQAYEDAFRGGVHAALGDVTGD